MLIFDMDNYPPTEAEHVSFPITIEDSLDVQLVGAEEETRSFGEDIGAVLVGSGVRDLVVVSYIANGLAERYDALSEIDEKIPFLVGVMQGAGDELSAVQREANV